MEDYAESITAERVRRVMRGYGEGKNATAGTGGAFDYYELGEPMFDEEKNLNENIGEEKIREYIYYTETKRHLERKRTEASKYLLDTHNATGYYFYYERDPSDDARSGHASYSNGTGRAVCHLRRCLHAVERGHGGEKHRLQENPA